MWFLIVKCTSSLPYFCHLSAVHFKLSTFMFHSVISFVKNPILIHTYIHTSVDILLDLLDRNFILKKKLSSESSWVKFKNCIHSTRFSFHCFVSSEFRVLVEYFWRSIATRVHSRLYDDTLNALLIPNKFYQKKNAWKTS